MAVRRGAEAGLTVRELLDIPQITNTLVAGERGLDRPVVWAHSCEMAKPWDWVGQDELLMTIGYCVPADPAAQVEFVRNLAAAGLAGIAIGDDAPAPTVSSQLRAEADRLAFPVIVTGHDIPFSVIARTVATANEHAELQRLWRMSRLNVAMGGSPRSKQSLLARVANELGQDIHVVDARHGTEIWPASTVLDAAVRDALTARVRDRLDRLPARTRLELDGWTGSCFPLPCNRPAMLVVPDQPDHRIDPFAVVHVATLMAVEVERLSGERDHLRREGQRLFGQLLEGRLDSDSATRQLRRLGIKRGPLVIVALPADQPDLTDAFFDRGLAHLTTAVSEPRLLLFEVARLERTIAALADAAAAGSSAPVHALTHVPDAAREARWALQAALGQGGGHVDYASARPLFLPRTVAEAQNAAETVLGRLLDYDRDHGSDLIGSLQAYLRCDRSWARAAEVLKVHRQTLGSRLAKIEQLTGRTLSRSGDIAECWLALQSLQTVDQPDHRSASQT